MIVIIAIAVLVLVVIAALFLGVRPPATDREVAFANLCATQRTNCGLSPGQIQVSGVYDVNGDGTKDATTNLLTDLCAPRGLSDEQACKRSCGCP
jgi:hypothetical protein